MFKKYPKAGTACRIRLNLEWTLQKREGGGEDIKIICTHQSLRLNMVRLYSDLLCFRSVALAGLGDQNHNWISLLKEPICIHTLLLPNRTAFQTVAVLAPELIF